MADSIEEFSLETGKESREFPIPSSDSGDLIPVYPRNLLYYN